MGPALQWRLEHPYASVAIAFVAGALAGLAKELFLQRAPNRTRVFRQWTRRMNWR